jgi:hypothetical protein
LCTPVQHINYVSHIFSSKEKGNGWEFSHLKNSSLIFTPNGSTSSPRNRAVLPHTLPRGLYVGHCLHNLFSLPAPTPTTSSRGAQATFRAKPFHVLYPTFSTAVTLRTYSPMKMDRQSVPKRWHFNYRRRGITQNNAYDSRNLLIIMGLLGKNNRVNDNKDIFNF